jgi:hypothetical protein
MPRGQLPPPARGAFDWRVRSVPDVNLAKKLRVTLAISAAPLMASQVNTATAKATCVSYCIRVTASALVPGNTYKIDYLITLTPACGSTLTIGDSIFLYRLGGRNIHRQCHETARTVDRGLCAVRHNRAGGRQHNRDRV